MISEAISASESGSRSWIERLWSSVADRGRSYADVLQPKAPQPPIDSACQFAAALLSERGEASGAAVARELQIALRQLTPADRLEFYRYLAENFLPPEAGLRAAAQAYLAEPTPERATQLAEAAEPARQELLRRMNMAQGGTAALVAMRKDLLSHLRAEPALRPLDSDLRHLFASWFNRGFLELRRIDWQTPAAVLEKLITYEAVHEIHGWDDLRRRLASDRRCFGFFHPALPGEPLIFVEVALTTGLASSIQPLLQRDGDEAATRSQEHSADTAIFYSISNCQDGLRGVSFGNFLIKQVVEELKAELPGIVRFSTLSPLPGFRRWLDKQLTSGETLLLDGERTALGMDFAAALGTVRWWEDAALTEALREPLTRLCAQYLTTPAAKGGPADPVARFHLGNGARLERVNWLGNTAARGITESYGIMVNYLYDPEQIEANHEAFVRGAIVRSPAVDALMGMPSMAPALQPDAAPAVVDQSRSLPMARRDKKSKEEANRMSLDSTGGAATGLIPALKRTKLNRQQIVGFWAAWFGWMLDGMDSVIYALVLGPALTELLPKSGIEATPANIGYIGSLMFALFLVGWGLSFIWGPISDRFGRTKSLAATVLVYALFTGAAAFAPNVWMLALFRFLAGIGVGGEWAMAGTYVAEAWPEDRRKMGAGYLQTGYYFGFFVAATLNYTVGASFGWRAMFLCGLAPVVVSIATLLKVKEPERWEHTKQDVTAKRPNPMAVIFSPRYLRQTITMSALLTVAIVGLWAGAVYEPTAIVFLSKQAGMAQPDAAKMASYGTALLSIGTILGCIAAPWLAERYGRRPTLAAYFCGMMVTIAVAFGWAFYLPIGSALPAFMTVLFFLGMFGGNFAIFSLWLPELFGTEARATAFAFCTSIGRFIGAGVNFGLAGAVAAMGTLGTPIAMTAVAFGLGLLIIPFARETRGDVLPE